MTLNCAIIDDEPLAVELLASYVKRTPFLNLTGGYNSTINAMKEIREKPVDILFLDIQMPELSGLEFAKILPKDTRIVFTTAFSEYALEGYESDALGYLLKPISYEKFLNVAKKGLDWYTKIQKINSYRNDRFMFVKSDYKLIRVDFDDIIYIEGLKDYVRIFLENGEKIMSLMNMKTLEDFLPAPEFMRTHRSYIVHTNKVKLVDRMRFVFGDTYIPVSDRYKDAVSDILDKYTLV